ncbi:MAG: tRNA1(Val) (adenine(37)-N6)-methyltransferase [Oscillospiraceae bacterium]
MADFNFEKLSEKIYVCASENHRFGTDAFLLADFSEYKKKDIVCDLGTGCGIIPLIMARDDMPPQKIYAVDIQENAIEQLNAGLEKSSDVDFIEPVCADMKNLWNDAPLGKCSLVTCNPPYKATNAGMESLIPSQRIARHEIMCNIDDVCRAADRLLKFGGRLCICNRPERLADVITAMKNHHIEPKRIRFVSKNPNEAPWLFLIEGKKGSKPFLKIMPSLYTHNGSEYSDEMKRIYKL